MTATPNDDRQDVVRTGEDQRAQEGAIARAMQSNIDRAPHPIAAAPVAAPDEREAITALARTFWNGWLSAKDADSAGQAQAGFNALVPALAARPAPVVSGEAVRDAARWLAESWGKSPSGRNNFVASNALSITRNLVGALGLTVADAPAADDEPCRCGPERCGGDAPAEPSRDCSVHGEAAGVEGGRA